MGELQVFNFDELPVNTITIENEPYVVGNEVAKILGYSNYRNAINNHVEEEDKLRTQIEYAGQLRNVTLINESGLYSLIFDASKQSKNEIIRKRAKKFKRWVTSEVLPTLRKTGTYQVPSNPMDALKLMFEATEQTKTEVEKVKADVTDLKENQRLDAGEYGFVTKAINQRVSHIKQQYALSSNKEVNRELFKDINSQVKKMTGISTRTQLKQKHFDDVLDMVNNWYPQPSTMYLIRQQEMEFEEE
ncbi:phage repressor protein [Staphylococcus chromogenes]|uniref:Phage repressor protein n=1 Tax=Staphylococcus chromogenes TaxID=46126 RepID=A0ABX5I6T6_STACR|nr:BRO family protein [Staphylococcus chromogenes]PTG03578.1 phage repressor protein [Staphylococcus chromogenes]PTG69114.1 phage repressor protein [Staphylococcus chromogenes]PTG84421.1 phage repressor protein [Staphylococcus chromogenes]PTH03365.1 phage repressor protein [Staphylococcus chromogenes]RIM08311.1 phage repressor protein [Staphylococcus chromogenes]